MLAGVPYADVFQHAKRTARRARKIGTTLTDLKRLASKVGLRFRIKDATVTDLDGDTGIMWLSPKKGEIGHLTVLFRGVLIDPSNGQLWDPETYLKSSPEYEFAALLTLD